MQKVAADFPNSPEALEAVSTARLIYIDNGRVEEYAAWVKTLNFIEVSNADLDNTTYQVENALDLTFQENAFDMLISSICLSLQF